jgi:hypothetical protein
MDDEAKFRESWDAVESHFAELYERAPNKWQSIVNMLRELRSEGYDEWSYTSRMTKYCFDMSRSQASIHFRLVTSIDHIYSLLVIGNIGEETYYLHDQSLPFSTELKIMLELLMVQPME